MVVVAAVALVRVVVVVAVMVVAVMVVAVMVVAVVIMGGRVTVLDVVVLMGGGVGRKLFIMPLTPRVSSFSLLPTPLSYFAL